MWSWNEQASSTKVHLGVDAYFVPAGKAHPAFLISGLNELIDVLTANGVEVRDDEPLPGFNRVYVIDPFGNRIELMEPREA